MSEPRQNGRIVRGVGGFYTIRTRDGQEYTLRARGIFRRSGISPLVGDRVWFVPGQGEEHGWIDEIMPRTSQSLRPPAANITLQILVVAPEPVPDLLLVDRMLVYAGRSSFETVLCVNKCDLDPSLSVALSHQYRGSGLSVYPASALTGEGLEPLRERMRGELGCMAGQSAVGKSTLLNALLGLQLKTGGMSEKIKRGKHTTRHAELLEAGDIAVLDTPGFSLLQLDADIEPEQLQDWYPDYSALQPDCRFSPCLHDQEPDCAVRAAVDAGRMDAQRYERYRLLLAEVRERWSRRYK